MRRVNKMDLEMLFRSGFFWLLLSLGQGHAWAEELAALDGVLPPTGQAAVQDTGFADSTLRSPLLEQIYAMRQGEPIWYDEGRLNGRAKRLAEVIDGVVAEGLTPDEYHLPGMDAQQLAQAGETLSSEYLLTEIYLRLAQDLHSGQFKPRDIDPFWHLPVEPFDPAEALQQLQHQTDPATLINALSPQYTDYQRLRRALQDYRQLASQGGWPRLPDFPTLRPGERRPEVALVRQRLHIEGDYPAIAPEEAQYFDDQLQASVKLFQRRNGLVADGVIGAKTQASLNITVEDRINQLRANMERWRWLPRDLGSQYLLVNTAGYELTLVVDGQPVLRQRTISGTQERQTPSFASRITHLVVNPKWTVPRLIAVKDLLPKQQRDGEFLARMGIQVFQFEEGQWTRLDPLGIDWRRYNENNFPFMLRQAPGDKNSLGRIKFQMNNPYAIFLHDTPAKGLFEKPLRAFSSGCIRVEGVDQLARRLLLNGGQAPDKTLDQPLISMQTHIQKLTRPVPVYLVYFTSWVDDEGRVHFRPDVYQRDNPLLLALRRETAGITASNYRESPNPL